MSDEETDETVDEPVEEEQEGEGDEPEEAEENGFESPPEMDEPYLSKFFDRDDGHQIEVYEEHGGYEAMKEAFEMDRESIVEEVKAANLRGRGGAGFPAGIKWGFIPGETEDDKYLVVNADESEPGTFKHRYIMEKDPHQLIEGCIIACWALGIRYGYIYVRGELKHLAYGQIQQAIEQCYEKGYLGEDILGTGFDLDLYPHISAGAYICGEETGMIEGLEGKPGKPRLKPPFPAVVGVFDKPTLINNVETIACVPMIIEEGGEAFAEMGVEKNGGPKLYGLSGPV
ncbi:MAG: hypothetical protein ABEL76_02150, partial [Bradymonadaceae bacterium]